MFRLFTLLFILLALNLNKVYSQWNQEIFQKIQEDSTLDSKWKLRGVHFLKNNEYFNRVNPGETFIGMQWIADRSFKVSDGIHADIGGFLQWDYGDKKIPSMILPVARLRIQKDRFDLVFGSLFSHIHHQMPDPLYSYESVMKRPIEYGIQFIQKRRLGRTEIWLDWRNKLLQQRGSQEELVGGFSHTSYLVGRNHLKMYIPLYALAYHRGGQNVDPTVSLVTRFNISSGLGIQWRNTFFMEALALFHSDPSPNRTQPYATGRAFWANGYWIFKKKTNEQRIALSYWRSTQLVNTLGNSIFSNVNLFDPYQQQRERELILVRYQRIMAPMGKDKPFKLDFRLEPYYDVAYSKMEFSASLHAYIGIGL